MVLGELSLRGLLSTMTSRSARPGPPPITCGSPASSVLVVVGAGAATMPMLTSSTWSVGQRNRSWNRKWDIWGTSIFVRWCPVAVVGTSSTTGTIFSTWVTVHLIVASIEWLSNDSNGQNSRASPSSICPASGWKLAQEPAWRMTSRT